MYTRALIAGLLAVVAGLLYHNVMVTSKRSIPRSAQERDVTGKRRMPTPNMTSKQETSTQQKKLVQGVTDSLVEDVHKKRGSRWGVA